MRKRTGGGKFDPHEGYIYFIASHMLQLTLAEPVMPYLLVAGNDLRSPDSLRTMDGFVKKSKVILDSGVYIFNMNYARANDIGDISKVRMRPPEEAEGFGELKAQYLRSLHRYADGVWGYVELDQGTSEDKTRTRATVEAEGYAPIPVYHPLADPPEYFDYLCTEYDRVCVGNLSQGPDRERIAAVVVERARKYPEVWVHLLGMTPDELFNAYLPSSSDSSAWLSALRWGGYKEFAAGAPLGDVLGDLQYRLGGEWHKGAVMAGIGAHALQRNLRTHHEALKALGEENDEERRALQRGS